MNGRLVVALVFVVGGGLVAFAGAQPEAALTPAEAHETDQSEVRVKGAVDEIDRDEGVFVLAGEGANLTVHMNQMPASLTPGKSLLASGVIVQTDQGRVLEAEEVQMGCPSKYEA